MDERAFVSKKRESWQQLEAILIKASKRGIKSLDRHELTGLGSLYRRVASDLAFVRNQKASGDIEQHLNALVGRAHALLYEAETTPRNTVQSTLNFFLMEFPAIFQRRVGYFYMTLLITIVSAVFAYGLVIKDPKNSDLFIPAQLKSSVEVWKSGNVSDAASPEASAFLMTNNFRVGFLAAASGILGGVPTVNLLYSNGVMLGGVSAVMTQVGKHSTFWPGIVPHGVSELTAIFVCGGAGLLLGTAVLIPKPYSRIDSLKVHGMEAVKMIIGTIPMFIFAGIIEGMFSHLPISASLRYTFAIANGILWYAYLFVPRKNMTFFTPRTLARNLQQT